MIRDFRHAIRVLLKEPSFAIVAILALATGIGANTAIFSVIEGVLLRPLPYPNPDRLVFIRSDFRGENGLPGIASAEIEDLRSQSKLIEQIGWLIRPAASLTGDQMERAPAAAVSDDFLPMLGVTPILGRHLAAKIDRPDFRARNLLISYELWQRRYRSDPNIIGRSIEVNNYTASIAGVLPEGFRLYLANDANVPPQIDIWFPADIGATPNRTLHRDHTIARLRPGVTLKQAQSEIDALTARMIERNPSVYSGSDFRLHVIGLHQDVTAPVRPVIFVLLCAVGFVLLIACANIANLLLARASGRKAEIAIRAALGAGRMRLMRQMLAESIVLALAGAVAGLLLANQGIRLLLYLKPDNLPRQDSIALNLPVALFALGLSLFAGILFGLAPAWQAARKEIQDTLRELGRSKTSGVSGNRIRAVLVAAQIALSLILLIGAVLMIRTFENMRRVDLGFDPANLLTLRVDYDSAAIRGAETWRFYKRAIEAVQNQPGVESATAANLLPFDPIEWTDSFAIENDQEAVRTALYNPILPEYFRTLRIPLSGRDFTERDNEEAAPVVIVDQNFADRTWPGQNAIGKKIILHPQSTSSRKTLDIVGVAQTARFGIRPDDRPQLYVPFGSDYGFFLMMAVRTRTSPVSVAPLIRRAIEEVGGKRPVWDVRTMEDYVADAVADTRFALILLALLSAIAFALSVIGIYSVVSYSISARLNEFAIRIAVGARASDILKLALTWGLTPAICGAVIGITGAVALTRLLRALLFDVSPTDTVSYVAASALLIVAAVVACYIPVRTLTVRADPKRFLQ